MKILIIDQKSTAYEKNKIKGGIQFVVDCQLKMLSDYEEEVLFLTHNDSDEVCYKNVKTLKTDIQSKNVSDLSGRKYNIKRNESIEKFILSENPDIIINHDQSNNSVVKLLIELSIPSITFAHNACEVIGGIAGLGYVRQLYEYVNSGGTAVNVSETSMNDWLAYSKRYCPEINDPETIFSNFIHTPYYENIGEVSESDGYGLMVSRISEDKKIHKVIKSHEDSKLNFHLCYVPASNDSDKEYFSKIKKEIKNYSSIFENLERQNVINKIKKAEYLCVAGPESFALTVPESFCSGTPVLLFKNKNYHPAQEIAKTLDLEDYLYVVEGRSLSVPNIKTSLEERKEIQRKSLLYFSKEKAYNRLKNVMDIAIQNCLNRKEEKIVLF